ncbi:thioredoxin family protein [Lutibacter sp.]|uniref:thioredoxin family protein n=1 Tax=Lutibacter sp. TaxID=1925666 RepID=UPI003563F943
MRKLFIVTLLLFWVSTNAQEINWMTLEKAVEAQKTNPKKIFIDAYTVWCGPCKMLDKNTFGNKDVAKYVNENYYAVKFNAEGNETINFKDKIYKNPGFNPKSNGRNTAHELSSYFGVRAYPTMLFLDENANLLTPITGYQTPRQLEIFLKIFAKDHYKTIQSQEAFTEYATNFKHEFVE